MTTRLKTEYTSTIEWVPLDSVEFYPQYCQRKFRPRHAKNIADEFDPDLFGIPLVVEITLPGRSKTSTVGIDGQHRIAAAKQALGNGQMIKCEVVRGISLARAAGLFVGRNATLGVRPIDKFLNNVRAGDAEAVAIKKLLLQYGLTVADGTGHGYTACVSTLLAAYRAPNGPERLSAALNVYTQSWGTERGLLGDVLGGVTLFLARYPEADRANLAVRLASVAQGAAGVLGKGRAQREGNGGTINQGIARALLIIYNAGRRTRLLPEWHETHKRLSDEDVTAVASA